MGFYILTTSNPDARTKVAVLPFGQFGVEIDTLKQKQGDGKRTWKDLPYHSQKANLGNFPVIEATNPLVVSRVGLTGKYSDLLEIPVDNGSSSASGDNLILEYLAATTIAIYDVVTSDGLLADSNTSSTRNKLIGLSKTATNSGFKGKAIGFGKVKNTAWTWTIGDKVFLNGTSLSVTAPTTGYSQLIGTAIASDTIDINIQATILL